MKKGSGTHGRSRKIGGRGQRGRVPEKTQYQRGWVSERDLSGDSPNAFQIVTKKNPLKQAPKQGIPVSSRPSRGFSEETEGQTGDSEKKPPAITFFDTVSEFLSEFGGP